MKKFVSIFVGIVVTLNLLCAPMVVRADETEVKNLYAKAAVLMDGYSGRVLYGKETDEELPMASTTKVMTCIIALENCPLNKKIEISEYAAKQPKVKLGMTPGDSYLLKDLLYALLLKSYNDAAVAIAEGVGGSVEAFAALMNQKAVSLGCTNTHFVTPNGLDGQDQEGIHHTTARELCLIMRYAIENPVFCQISQTMDYTFENVSRSKSHQLHNGNGLLSMMNGVMAGKTGFTAKAGYCYVCAIKKGENLYIISLLACGWPNHKNYKWKDVQKLLNYGNNTYHYLKTEKIPKIPFIQIINGRQEKAACYVGEFEPVEVLIGETESLSYRIEIKKERHAPVKKGQTAGELIYEIQGAQVKRFPIIINESVGKWTIEWCWQTVWGQFL